MRILDRYILRSFLEPFLLCFLGFLSILIIFDLNNNLGDFMEGRARSSLILTYYAHQLPHFIMLSVPVALLLALLYCLSKLSRSNEIISMLTAGRSIPRILVPLFIVCAIVAGVCTALNYELAPHADAMRSEDIARIKMGDSEMVKWKFHVGHVAKDRTTNRLWFASVYRKNLDSLLTVHITQLDSAGRPITRWYAEAADYDARTARWILRKGKQVQFDSYGNVTDTTDDWTQATGSDAYRVIDGWTETPFRLASTRMDVEQLSVAELHEYLNVNSDFPGRRLAPFQTHLQHRFAVPFTCFSVIFIAAPLGIVFSRRAVLASVASSILIFFIFLFSTFLFLALGKGGHVSPFAAAWMPNIGLMLVGLYLLYLRSTNREAFAFLSRRK